MGRVKNILKSITPPFLLDLYKEIFHDKYGWHGNYKDWNEVLLLSSGYDSEVVLNTVKKSLKLVKLGEEIYERDGVLFEEIQYNWPLLSGLMYIAANSKCGLHIVDFGGSLGSTYYQNRNFLRKISSVKWGVVEQVNFVDEGKRNFQDENLSFYYSVKDCLDDFLPNALLLSSVLQYIEKPYELLDEILKYGNFKYIIVDRTPFLNCGKSIIKQQIVNPRIYDASYPCWFFDLIEFKEFFEKKGFYILEKFDALDGVGKDYNFYGFFMELKEN